MSRGKAGTGQWKSRLLDLSRRRWFPRVFRGLVPQGVGWRGAVAAGGLVWLLISCVAAISLFGPAGVGRVLAGTALLALFFAIAGLLLTVLLQLLRTLKPQYIWVAAAVLVSLVFMALTGLSVAIGILVVGLGLLVAASVVGAAAAVLLWGDTSKRRRLVLALLVAGVLLLTGLVWVISDGHPVAPPPTPGPALAGALTPLSVGDPTIAGPYEVRTLVYGSGTDLRRLEYGEGVDLATHSVDGSAFVEGWSSLRTSYWGFDSTALPLNGHVWYPADTGPFPLVLFVHGQHPMEDSSDLGYAYLGEMLASRGYVVASVDENFLNLSPLADLLVFSGLKGENDLRGWLLLEHLRLWSSWTQEPDSPLYGLADMQNVALVGHSRGGEAVAIAAAFNHLPAYPDNGGVVFDYGYGIRAVVGISPVDGVYQAAGQDLALEDTSYLVLHGSHDMDVFTFQGSGQYERARLSQGGDTFKASLYVYGANHGQFNTSWGRKDLFEPVMRVFNLRQLMAAEDQQQVAEVAISAFLDAALRGESEYRRFFQDVRVGADWLPDTVLFTEYADGYTTVVADYEEDVDLTTVATSKASCAGEGLTVWREQPLPRKWEAVADQVVVLGWANTGEEVPATYSFHLADAETEFGAADVLVFSMSQAEEDPTPDADDGDLGDPHDVDFTIELVDLDGDVSRLPLSHTKVLRQQLSAQLGKAGFMSPFPTSEPVMDHFELSLADFRDENPAFDPTKLAVVRFVFDRSETGVIFLDDVGVRSY